VASTSTALAAGSVAVTIAALRYPAGCWPLAP